MIRTPGRRAAELSSTTYWPTMRTPSARYSMSWVRILSLPPSLVADTNGGRLTRQRLAATSRPAWHQIPLSALRPARPGSCTWGTCARRCSIGCSPSGMAAPSSCASTTPTGSAASPSTKPRSSATLPGSASIGRARSGRSDRLPHYDAARDRLIAIGRLYPCYETPEELEFKRKRLLVAGPAAGLRPRRAQARRRRSRAARRRRPPAALALQARHRGSALGRPGARARSTSTRRARAIRCWCAPTAATSTASPRWSTTSPSASPT